MVKLSPKQNEIRAREARILELARPMVASGGLAALSMDTIAQLLNSAKGTVYNHFPNKEEIVLALAVQAVETRLALFNHAVMMRENPRARISAIGIACEMYADHFRELFLTEILVRNENVLEKTSTKRQEVLRNCEGRCMHVVAGVVRDGVACGDLQLRTNQTAEDIVFGLWSLVYGGLLIEATSPSLTSVGINHPRQAIRLNCNAMLDGIGWMPLYKRDQYERLTHKIEKHLKVFLNTK
jgi:AcrR family transcriptional regulator